MLSPKTRDIRYIDETNRIDGSYQIPNSYQEGIKKISSRHYVVIIELAFNVKETTCWTSAPLTVDGH